MSEAPDVPTAEIGDLNDDVVLLDVRRDDEWEAGHASGAVHIPDDQLADRLAELPVDTQVFVACHGGGGRSTRITEFLTQQGYRARRLDGGMVAYAEAGLPLESETGDEPTVID
jgi:rhodanese-related sulfurtransferase